MDAQSGPAADARRRGHHGGDGRGDDDRQAHRVQLLAARALSAARTHRLKARLNRRKQSTVFCDQGCGDAYTAETADGKSRKIWEFNLRLKSDSRKSGPALGKPVVIGAGMQGER